MRTAMYEAEVGDDVARDDPTTNRLEHVAAERLGKEASLFVPSGTFGNQVSIFSHCSRGDELIIAEHAHIVGHEVGAAAILAGAQLRTVPTRLPYPVWDEIEPRIRKEEDIHIPPTGLIALENALSSGDVLPLEEMKRIHEGAHRYGIPIHLDGARLFNAAAYLGVDASEIASRVDSLMFCLSKGLCAPIGSMVAGEREFIERTRRRRKIMGGGMRQTGILAAAGLVALEKIAPRVGEDRATAELLAEALKSTGVIEVRPDPPKINMIFMRFKDGELAGRENRFVELLAERGIKTYPRMSGWIRFVTHYYITADDIGTVAGYLDGVLEELRKTAA